MEEGFLNAFQRRYGGRSKKWKNWIAQLDLKTCLECRKMHGKIYDKNEKMRNQMLQHLFCRCEIKPMKTFAAGYATIKLLLKSYRRESCRTKGN